MEGSIYRLDSICAYNDYCGQETLHPLVTIVDFSKMPKDRPRKFGRFSYGMYMIMIKDVKCGELLYGRNSYDYQEGTLVFLAPHQILEVRDTGNTTHPKGFCLAFHPDLIKGTTLGRKIKDYTFFSYEVREALHLSEQERRVVDECLNNIITELHHAIDKHSRSLIINNIELLLNYCVRFYDRQFITRENVNKDLLTRFENLLNDYFERKDIEDAGLPSVSYFANKLSLSANYFGDLIKKETGKTAQEFIQYKLIDLAKERILDSDKSVSEIAYELGFKYPQHFTRLFKKRVGMSPMEYRKVN